MSEQRDFDMAADTEDLNFGEGRSDDASSWLITSDLPWFDTNELDCLYDELLQQSSVRWTVEYRIQKPLGSGGQGVVYLVDRLGADGMTVPVALKLFSPNDTRSWPTISETWRGFRVSRREWP